MSNKHLQDEKKQKILDALRGLKSVSEIPCESGDKYIFTFDGGEHGIYSVCFYKMELLNGQ